MSTASPSPCFEILFVCETSRKLKHDELLSRIDNSSSAPYSSISRIFSIGYRAKNVNQGVGNQFMANQFAFMRLAVQIPVQYSEISQVRDRHGAIFFERFAVDARKNSSINHCCREFVSAHFNHLPHIYPKTGEQKAIQNPRRGQVVSAPIRSD